MPPVANPQSQAIGVVNQYAFYANQMYAMTKGLEALNAQATEQGTAALLSEFGTVALNPDGSPGTADVSPNTAHPMDPGKYPGFDRMVSEAQVAALTAFMNSMTQIIDTNENMAVLAPFVGQ